jgi:hypothetical protein
MKFLKLLIKQIRSSYLSMGFGNPYGDPWDVEIVDWTEKLSKWA